jgi:DnaK suppressor protein
VFLVARKSKNNDDGKQAKKPKKAAVTKPARQARNTKRPAVARKPEPVVIRSKTTLTMKELAHFQQLLLAKRAELIGDVNSMEDEALQKSKLSASGDLSTMPIHMADIGTANYEQEFALGLLDGERKLLREINDALQRIEERTYGVCEGTGKEISKARLEANPWARYCVEYARMVEQGLVKEGQVITRDEEEEPEDVLDEEEILDDDEAAAEEPEEEEETEEPAEEQLPEEEELEEEDVDWRESKEN